jgi:hypothetical protein
MKRYLLFGSQTWLEGWDSYYSSFMEVEKAKDVATIFMNSSAWSWWQVVDSRTGEIVDRSKRS